MFYTANGLGPFQKANQGARQPSEPRSIELWTRWLIDPKGWVLTINELMCGLDALIDKTSCEYQAWGEKSMSLDTRAGLLEHLMHLFVPCLI